MAVALPLREMSFPEKFELLEALWDDLSLKPGLADGRSASAIGCTRLPASRAVSPFRYSRFEPGSLVQPSTNPSQPPSIPGFRLSGEPEKVQSPAWHKDVLDERRRGIEAGEDPLSGWETAKKDIRQRLG